MVELSCDLLTGENIFCAFVRFCDTTTEKISKIKPPSNSHDNFNEKVTHIVFYRGTLPTFPSELGEFFPNLKYIDFFDCGMETIKKEDLRNFPKLEKLKLEGNKLKFLANDLFDFTPKISLLNFADNKIKAIGENLLDNLKDLVEANFTGNVNIDHTFSRECCTLEELKEVIRDECKPLRSLKELSVDVLIKSIDCQDKEDVRMVAKCLEIENLMTKIEINKIV